MKIVLLFVFAAAAYAAACSASPTQSLCNYVVNVLPSGAGAPSSTDASSVNLVFSTTFPSSPPGASASLANGVVYTVAQGGGGFYNPGLPASPIYAQSGLYDGGSAPNVAGLSVTGLSTGNYTFTVWTYDAANPLSHNVYISTSPNNLGSPVASVPAASGSASFSYQIQAGQTYQIAAQRIGSGRSSFNALQVSLPDNTPPSITCPTEQRIPLGTGCFATLGWPCPTVSDSCGFPTNGLQQTGLPSGLPVFSGLSGGVTYTATDLSGASSSCSFTVTVFDDIPPVLSGGCPTGTLFATALPGQCVGTAVLPSNTLTVSDNCGTPQVWYNVAGAYDTANGFDPVRGPYNAGSTISLPVGNYSLQIRARGSIDYNSPSRFSTFSCTLPVQVVDLQPPVVCEPSQSVTGPCGSSAHQDWITTGGWAQVIDNCGQRRGQFLSSAPEFCGASPVFERRNFVFRDFGGNQVVYTGNVTYTTGDASCTCNYTRPLLTFDTDVTSNGGIVQIPESLPIPFESSTVFDCLRQRVTTYNINKRAVACTVPEWHYNRSWSTTSPNSAAIYLPGNFPNCSATNSWVFQLVSPNYPLGLLVDFLTGVQQPIRWQQHYRFLDRLNQPTNDAATVWMSLYYNSANNGVETPLLHFPVPAYYIKSDCPHVNVTYGFSNYFVNASDLCTVTLNTDFWPDVIGHFLSNSTTSKRSVHVERIMDTIKEARQIPDLPESIFDSPIGFQVVNVINAWTQAGLGVPLSQFLLNSFDVSIDWVVVSNPLVGAVTRGTAKRVLPVPPVQPTGRYFHIDSVTVGNTGHNAFNTSVAYNTTLDNQLASCYNSLSNILVQQGVIPGQTVDITDPFYSGLGLNFTEITTCIAAVLSLI